MFSCLKLNNKLVTYGIIVQHPKKKCLLKMMGYKMA